MSTGDTTTNNGTKYQVSEYRLAKELITRGGDIIFSENIEPMKSSIQHGTTSVFAHCLSVAKHSLLIAAFLENRFNIKVDRTSLVRGALLHDYFLYDWHDKEVPGRKIHGFTHPKKAMNNAVRDFEMNSLERDVISKHMFPLTPIPPRHRESLIVCIADKWCAICETFKLDVSDYLINRVNAETEMMLALNRVMSEDVAVALDNI
ncbi:uncharacterized protein SAMN02910456_02651 [Ruminococcaceae bacterium YRB3002]|nr:uncharacterized protein SAMN02910456_02651 [Ruminococcaceae bacterium YRB3002]